MRKILIVSGIIIAVIIAVCGVKSIVHSKKEYKIQKEIAGSLIRFHVRANSDSDEDQNLKIKVKNEIVTYLRKRMDGVTALDEARKILYDDSDFIRNMAVAAVRAAGYDYDVKVHFTEEYFPLKQYGDMSFPPGEYEAFRVDIGDAEGRNWWCVLFPPLCFVDSTLSVVPDSSKDSFRVLLSEEAYRTVTMKSLSSGNCRIRFKYFKFLNKIFE